MKAKETRRYVLGLHAANTRGGAVGWLVYRVEYADGTSKTENGPLLAPREAAELGLYAHLQHAALAVDVLTSGLSDRDEKLRSKRRKR